MLRYKLRTLLIVLAVLQPALALGKSERHDYRERKQLRHAAKRVTQGGEILKPAKLWQGFQLDVF